MKKLFLSTCLLILITSLKAQVSPGGVSTNLNYWLKADAGITTFDDAIGGIPIQRVSQWDNQTTGSTNNIGGVEDFRRPVFIENGLNFNPAINFDGNNDFLRTDNGWDSHSVIIVFNPTSTLDTNTGVQLILVYDVPNNAAVDSGIGIGDLGAVSSAYAACSDNYFFNSGDQNIPGTGGTPEFIGCSGDATTTSTEDAVLAVVRPNITETSLEHKLFGADQTTNVVNPSEYGVHTNRPFTIGQRHGGGFFYGGDVLEAISYSSRVSDADILKIESYLAIKYGLTLDQTLPRDYISSNGIPIYDADGILDSFDFNIAGIGRDDASGLNQKQSISSTTNSVQTNTPGIVTIGLGNIANTNAENINNFSTDQSFMVWGTNGMSTNVSTGVTLECGAANRMARIWAIQETGTVGNTAIQIPESELTVTFSPSLIVSSNATFSENNTIVPLTLTNGNYTATFDFDNNSYFSFGEFNDLETTYDASAGDGWSNNTPTFVTRTIITENYNTATQGASIDACELIITNNATLTIAAGDYLNVFGNITVDSGATLIIEHEASLVQTDPMATVTNNGTINVLLETPELKPRDFILLGSPMTTESAAMVFNSADKVFSHNTTNFIPHPDVTTLFPMAENFIDDNFNDYTPHTGTITPAEGYLVRPRPIDVTGNEIYSVTYTQGTLNNGAITYPVTYNNPGDGSLTPAEIKAASFNLLANPYPSAITAATFIDDNPTVSEVFFWESVQSPSNTFPGSFNENFSMEDVSIFNATGGVAAASDPTTTPNGFIATGQGFAIKANQAGIATFTNAMRVTGNNNTLRTAELGAVNKLWLTVTNQTYNKQSETLIGFTDLATVGFDQGYDTNRIPTAVSLYSHITNSDKELAIQSVGAFTNDIQIALGFSTMIDTQNSYTISLKNFEGIDLENTTVYLVDTVENSTTNISKETYDFTAIAGTYNNRFILQFRDNTALSTSNFNQDTISIFPNPTNGELFINNTSGKIIEAVKITDVRGKLLHTQTVSSNSYTMDIHSLAPTIYFVTITTEKGSVVKQIIKK